VARNRGLGSWARLSSYRGWVQLGSAVVTNSWFTQRVTKGVPCLALNCYACPLAVTACPIGSLQHLVALRQAPLYILGVIGLAGALGGRLACGWLCPFGWLQEWLNRIPVPKWRIRPRKRARWWVLLAATLVYAAGGAAVVHLTKDTVWPFGLYLTAGLVLYALLGASYLYSVVGLVVILPLLYLEPWFCKLCPAGMLEGGIPQVLIDVGLRELVGSFFWLKLGLLVLFLTWTMVTRRPFCRWICPLGALWSPMNRWSTLQIEVDQGACRRCGRCQQVCPVDIRIYEDPSAGACVRCMRCVGRCPTSCITVRGI
jgi:ferredoxin-type protein NapH